MGSWNFSSGGNGPKFDEGRFRFKLNWGFLLMVVGLLGAVGIIVAAKLL